MSTFDYILNSLLVLLVLVQMRERKFDRTMVTLPLAIVGIAAQSYLTSIPSAGNDLVLEIGLTLLGAAMGAAAGAFTSVRSGADRVALVRAGYAAAAIWIVGVGARMAFAYASTHGEGHAIAQFSRSVSITSGSAWTAAFVMMALTTVLARLGVIAIKARRAGSVSPFAPSRLVRA